MTATRGVLLAGPELSSSPDTKRAKAAAPPAPTALLRLQKFGEAPYIEYGEVKYGASYPAHVTVENPTPRTQAVTIEKLPAGFCISVEGGDATRLGAGASLTVPASSSVAVTITWQPKDVGAVREVVTLNWENRRLQVVLHGSAVLPAQPAAKGRVPLGTRSSSSLNASGSSLRAALSSSLKPSAPAAAEAAAAPAAALATMKAAAPAKPPPSRLTLKKPSAATAQKEKQPVAAAAAAEPQQASSPVSLRLESSPTRLNATVAGATMKRPGVGLAATLGAARTSSSSALGMSSTLGRPAPLAVTTDRKSFSFFHTGLWMEKQERAFKAWMNAVLTPATPDYLKAAAADEAQEALSSGRLTARVRGLMWRMYSSSNELVQVMLPVEQRIDEGRLRLHDNAAPFSDLRLRDKAIGALLAYNPFWLRLGLETVTGRPVLARDGGGGGSSGEGRRSSHAPGAAPSLVDRLASFIKHHFLHDDQLEAELVASHGLGASDRSEFVRKQGALLLKRFLLLVLLLDRMVAAPDAAARLPPGTPLLFRVDTPVKRSSDVIMAFLHEQVHGEGNLLRQLDHMGYRVTYAQKPLQEYSFLVDNLASDLRDGIRLARLHELLTGDASAMACVKHPADRKPLRLHNVEAALQGFRAAGVSFDSLKTVRGPVSLAAEDVVTGDRERTLGMLWQVVLELQVPRLVGAATLRAEVSRVLAKMRVAAGRRVEQPLAVYINNECINLLMEWVTAVCLSFGLRVHNFTSCFADGRALCMLIAYYLPRYLHPATIYTPSMAHAEAMAAAKAHAAAQEAEWEDGTDLEQLKTHGWARTIRMGGGSAVAGQQQPPSEADLHKRGVARNFAAVHKAAAAIGNVPEMLSPSDFTDDHGPDERCVVLYTAFLCSRLLDVSKEDRAAHVIQTAWRGLLNRRAGALRAHLNAWINAAKVVSRAAKAWIFRRAFHRLREQQRAQVRGVCRLQAAWRARPARQHFLRLRAAAVVIQAAWRAHAAVRRNTAAQLIQRRWREFSAQKALVSHVLARCSVRYAELAARRVAKKQQEAAVVLQAAFRGHRQRSAFQATRRAAVMLQSQERMRQARKRFQRARAAATTIQGAFRRWLATYGAARKERCALLLQAAWRGYVCRSAFRTQRSAAVVLQAQFKMVLARRAFLAARASASAIQAAWRGHLARVQLARQQAAATVLQAAWKAHACRRQFATTRRAVTTIRAAWLAHRARSRFLAARAAVVTVQRHFRGHAARAQLANQHAAAARIQAAWKAYAQFHAYWLTKAATIYIQAAYKRYRQRKAFLQQRAAAVKLQAAWRARQAQQLLRRHKATRTIQAAERGRAARTAFLRQRSAAVAVQAAWRGHVSRQQYLRARQQVIACQAAARCWLARTNFLSMRAAAITIQSAFRSLQARRQLATLRAVVTIQAQFRGWAARHRLACQQAAAVAIQKTWRMHAARRAYLYDIACVVVAQAVVRRHQQRKRFLEARAAATVLQAHARGLLARRQLAAEQAAAVKIQAAMRGWFARREFQGMVAMQAAMAEFEAAARAFVVRTQAATLIQAVWRGHSARLVFAPVWAVHQQSKAEERAAVVIQRAYRVWLVRRVYLQHRAALQVLSRHARMLLDRCRYLRARRQVVDIQRAWRQRLAAKRAAAVVLQSHVRRWRAQREARATIVAVTRVQALWRGYRVRKAADKATKEALKRLGAAEQNEGASRRAIHRSIGERVREALAVLQSNKQPAQVLQAVAAIQFSTSYSQACCALMAENGGIAALLRLARTCSRVKQEKELLLQCLSILHNICRWKELVPLVFGTEECLVVLTERLQFFRDSEDVFLAALAVVERLVAPEAHALDVARQPSTVRQWEGIAQIVGRKMEAERKYIARLEGQKGSDASARDATKKMLAAARQVEALNAVIGHVVGLADAAGIAVQHAEHVAGSTAGGDTAEERDQVVPAAPDAVMHPGVAWQPKNTIVRATVREIAAPIGGPTTRAMAAAAAADPAAASKGAAAAAKR